MNMNCVTVFKKNLQLMVMGSLWVRYESARFPLRVAFF